VGHRAHVLVAAAIAALVFSCGGSSRSDDRAPRPAVDAAGKLIYSRPDAIVELDVASGEMVELLRAETPTSFLLDPAVSDNNRQLAYVMQPPAQIIDGRYDAGTDLWVANRDGTGARMVYRHTQPNALVRFPRWTPDGDIVAIIQQIEEVDGIAQVAYTVQRLDPESGQLTKLLDDAYAIAVSPDGSRIAYAKPLADGNQRLEEAPLDGSSAPAVLVEPSENLLPFNSPVYSPDGASIAFASADQTAAREGGAMDRRMRGREHSLRRALGTAASPERNGLPEDIWLVSADSGRPRLLAELKEDLPSLTWSGDGEHIYVLGSAGLYEIDATSGAVTRIGEGAFHGQIDWAP
jgi:Tol biopolymer transport system component